ncbi:hypothetical protein, partial [Crocosphaera watsonii]|uniref:hypothetical protein n=1 Tax=Crocosphaera watsonii TaxID=263511 RepID=UPI001E503E4F
LRSFPNRLFNINQIFQPIDLPFESTSIKTWSDQFQELCHRRGERIWARITCRNLVSLALEIIQKVKILLQ